VEYFEFGSVTYCTNVPGGTYPSDEEAAFAAQQVSEAFQRKLGSSPYSNEISVTRVEYGFGCILTTITVGGTVGALYKFIKDYPKFRPGLILLLKDLNGLYVKLKNTENKGSTYLMRDDIPEPKELEMIAEESAAGKRMPVKKASGIKRRAPGKASE